MLDGISCKLDIWIVVLKSRSIKPILSLVLFMIIVNFNVKGRLLICTSYDSGLPYSMKRQTVWKWDVCYQIFFCLLKQLSWQQEIRWVQISINIFRITNYLGKKSPFDKTSLKTLETYVIHHYKSIHLT